MIFEKTIKKSGSISGVGLHTGAPCEVFFKPAAAGEGVQFFKNGISIDRIFKRQELVGASALRCTAIGEGNNQILTVEHLLAALSGLGICNIKIEVNGPEIPSLDGSAKGFVDCLKRLGLVDQAKAREIYAVKEPLFCHGGQGKALAIYPAPILSIGYMLDYDTPSLKAQGLSLAITQATFEKEIAPARTFCTEDEIEALKKKGYGRGADLENTLVVTKNRADQKKLRFSDECARHKILDIIGDLALLDFAVVGHIVGLRSGHALNQELALQIYKKKQGETPR